MPLVRELGDDCVDSAGELHPCLARKRCRAYYSQTSHQTHQLRGGVASPGVVARTPCTTALSLAAWRGNLGMLQLCHPVKPLCIHHGGCSWTWSQAFDSCLTRNAHCNSSHHAHSLHSDDNPRLSTAVTLKVARPEYVRMSCYNMDVGNRFPQIWAFGHRSSSLAT